MTMNHQRVRHGEKSERSDRQHLPGRKNMPFHNCALLRTKYGYSITPTICFNYSVRATSRERHFAYFFNHFANNRGLSSIPRQNYPSTLLCPPAPPPVNPASQKHPPPIIMRHRCQRTPRTLHSRQTDRPPRRRSVRKKHFKKTRLCADSIFCDESQKRQALTAAALRAPE